MEEILAINSRFMMAAVQIFFCISLVSAGVAGRYFGLGAMMKWLMPYFYSFYPVALLIYSLYMVSKMQ